VKIPRSHPRYASLVTREKLVAAYRTGVLAPEGLIAHGRGEAFDYLFGEESPAPALVAERAAAAHLLEAKHPVISVNGNVAVLAAKEVGRLARAVPATVEVNLFHRTDARVRKKFGIRIAARTAIITTTISNSISEKPLWLDRSEERRRVDALPAAIVV